MVACLVYPSAAWRSERRRSKGRIRSDDQIVWQEHCISKSGFLFLVLLGVFSPAPTAQTQSGGMKGQVAVASLPCQDIGGSTLPDKNMAQSRPPKRSCRSRGVSG